MNNKEFLIIKLVSGEEILGKIIENTETSVKLSQVFQVLIIPQEDGGQQIGLIPFHIHSNLHKVFPVKREFVIFEYFPSQQLLDVYNRFTSPIIQQPPGLIGV